jgi:DNA-binding response OmpR family regulator
MDLRVLVLTPDHDLSELVRAQVENLGCRCSVAPTYGDATAFIGWAEAAVIDLVGDGVDDLNRLRVEAPLMRTLAIAPDAALEASARSAGASQVLVEPFAIADIVTAVRAMGRGPETDVVDLRTPAPAAEEAPWWASR